MQVSLREAATLLRRPVRTLRGQIARGEIRATKVQGRWQVDVADLPMTEDRQQRFEDRVQHIEAAVDAAIPAQLRTARQKPHRSVVDLIPFREGLQVLPELDKLEPQTSSRSRALLDRALLDLAEAAQDISYEQRALTLRRARASFGRLVGLLHMVATTNETNNVAPELITRLETTILPSLGGLLRWTEARAARPHQRLRYGGTERFDA